MNSTLLNADIEFDVAQMVKNMTSYVNIRADYSDKLALS